MRRRIAISAFAALSLSNCSYGFDVMAVVREGKLTFIVAHSSSPKPSCLRRVEVFEEDGQREPLWRESVDYNDGCANKFPLSYGVTLRGKHQSVDNEVTARSLERGVIYNVSITTGTGGYGGGRFVVLADGRVENLKDLMAAKPGSRAIP